MTETLKEIYVARGHNTGGRVGRATALDGYPDLQMDRPKELGGPDDQEGVTNPEELFALGYGACFLSALQYVARQEKISAKAFEIGSVVRMLSAESGMITLGVELHGTLPGIEQDKAAELMQTAHKVCPYSRATRGNIEVKLFAGEQELEQHA
jgi:lipoyl-dependent peroxiredoxin